MGDGSVSTEGLPLKPVGFLLVSLPPKLPSRRLRFACAMRWTAPSGQSTAPGMAGKGRNLVQGETKGKRRREEEKRRRGQEESSRKLIEERKREGKARRFFTNREESRVRLARKVVLLLPIHSLWVVWLELFS